jgi:hypothetical protein
VSGFVGDLYSKVRTGGASKGYEASKFKLKRDPEQEHVLFQEISINLDLYIDK